MKEKNEIAEKNRRSRLNRLLVCAGHPCEILYLFASNKIYGDEKGICRITGKESTGINFDGWVKDTFTDHAYLYPGQIISNEALFSFEESSELIAQKVNKEKPQRFRTYSHIVANGEWYVLTKAQKKEIYELILNNEPDVCVISDSGQRHLLFKHKIGTWQFEDQHIKRDKKTLAKIKLIGDELISNNFSKAEVLSGNFVQHRIMKYGVKKWLLAENELRRDRGSAIFDLGIWLSQKQGEIDADS
jgi:hypothetical protein